mgnify:CR=1 FL=1
MRCDAEFSHDVTLAMMGYVTIKASKTDEKKQCCPYCFIKLYLELYFGANEFFGLRYSKPVSLPVIRVKYSWDFKKENFLEFSIKFITGYVGRDEINGRNKDSFLSISAKFRAYEKD